MGFDWIVCLIMSHFVANFLYLCQKWLFTFCFIWMIYPLQQQNPDLKEMTGPRQLGEAYYFTIFLLFQILRRIGIKIFKFCLCVTSICSM